VPWYVEAFGLPYLTIYSHRDERDAGREAVFAAAALGLSPGDAVLDLACGWGRHARAMVEIGLDVIGLDLSPDLLREARARGGGVSYLRGDMRRLPFRSRFRGVTLFFTSFGYFEEEEQDREVLRSVARALEPGGRLLLDTINRERTIRDLVPESEEVRRGVRIRQSRRLSGNGRRILKRVRLSGPGREPAEYTESVRLYAPEEIDRLLSNAGFSREARYGSLAGRGFLAESPRLVVVGRTAC
jgi:ubiquinone/menaquinone biosynthesis C-methylase UbiE